MDPIVKELLDDYNKVKNEPIVRSDYEKIIRAEKCTCCGSEDIDYMPNRLEPGQHLYVCKNCEAYTWSLSHKVKNPKGIIGDSELRSLQTKVHLLIEPMIKKKHMKKRVPLGKATSLAYDWIRGVLGIEDERINCWRMNKDQCRSAIKELEKYY